MYPFPPPGAVGSTVGIVIIIVGSVVATVVGMVVGADVGTIVGSGVTMVGSVVGWVTGWSVTRVVIVVFSSPSAPTGTIIRAQSVPRIAAIRRTERVFFTLSHPVLVHLENALFIGCVLTAMTGCGAVYSRLVNVPITRASRCIPSVISSSDAEEKLSRIVSVPPPST